jgi:hypothetical protein
MDADGVNWFQEQYRSGAFSSPQSVMPLLRANPKEFLKKYPTVIDERIGASALISAYMINHGDNYHNKPQRPGTVLGTKRMHDTEAFKISATGVPPTTHPAIRAVFASHYVEMLHSTVAVAWYALSGTANLLTTCKLSGCSFLIRENHGVVECAHVKPSGLTGAALQGNLQVAHTDAVVFGASDDYDSSSEYATIIGAFIKGRWKIYAQVSQLNTMKSLRVKRIYPA